MDNTRIFKLVLAVVLIGLGLFAAFKILTIKNIAGSAVRDIEQTLQEAAEKLLKFDVGGAAALFNSANKNAALLQDQAGGLGLLNFYKIKDGFSGLLQFTETAAALSNHVDEIKSNVFFWTFNQKGDRLIKKLSEARTGLVDLKEAHDKLGSLISAAEDKNQSANLSVSERFLDVLIDWLRKPFDQHILLLFQNPSEIRPTGGFLGSFAVISLRRGSINKIAVENIYDPDGQLDIKIVPPKPLQLITARWGARDANWFFDFPTSARKVIQYLEASKIYSERGIKFSGALAVNTDLIRDFLRVTGPINLSDYELIINADNFLSEIQAEVEAGDDKAAGQPKKILKVLAPKILEKLGNLNDDQKNQLAKILKHRAGQKDIQIYFKDLAIETYLQTLGLGGEVMKLPDNFWGNYLAVVNTNIGGAKSDVFMKQKIELKGVVQSDGGIASRLIVTRRHDGDGQKEWWYRKSNQNWLQTFLNPAAKIISFEGYDKKEIKPPVNYDLTGYQIDPDVRQYENSGIVFGKKVIRGWLKIQPGEQRSVQINYLTPPNGPLINGRIYTFIYEKQSGIGGGLEFVIRAPTGYFWQETQSPDFHYSVENPPARVILTLTLRNQK